MRILSVDPGTKRVGLAACDALQITTRPLSVLRFSNAQNLAKDLVQLIQDEEFERILFGLPFNMDGTLGPAAKRSQQLVKYLERYLIERKISCSVVMWDERLTTDEAKRRQRERGISSKKGKTDLDSWAAEVLLQDYLRSLE